MVHGGILPSEEEGTPTNTESQIEEQLDAFLKKAHGKGLDDVEENSVRDGGAWELLYLVSTHKIHIQRRRRRKNHTNPTYFQDCNNLYAIHFLNVRRRRKHFLATQVDLYTHWSDF